MSQLMTARQALDIVYKTLPADTCYVVANGYLSRDAFNASDREGNFYMLGSMGLASSIALGAALARPERRVVVLDGDGNVLMGLGALTVVASSRPANLYHLCFDNGVYASTGNQPTVADGVSLEGIAREAGYLSAARVERSQELEGALDSLLSGPGPAFLRVMISRQEHPRQFPRVSHTPEEIVARFSGALREETR